MSYEPVEAVAEEMVNVINRQSAELERLRTRLSEANQDAGNWQADALRHYATIDRVREVSDRHPDAPWLSGPAIRAALKGDTNA